MEYAKEKRLTRQAYLKACSNLHEGYLFTCNYCLKNFSRNGNLIKHIQAVHENKKSFICNYCGKNFFYNSHLIRHCKTVHPNEKLFGCKYCHQIFQQKKVLKNHIQAVHENLNIYSDKQIKTIETNKKHAECNYSEKNLSQKTKLINHQTVHKNAKTLTCIYCNKKFGSSRNLNRHFKTVHAIMRILLRAINAKKNLL